MILVERYAVVAEMWRYMIAVTPAEVRALPVPDWAPAGARALVGFAMNLATTAPRKALSSGRRKLMAMGRHAEGWNEPMRERVASQVEAIRHWRVIEGDYTEAPDIEATWFVDPPYANKAGSYYVHHDVDHAALGLWCRSRRGQVIACENEGAMWLPFRPLATLKAGVNGSGSREVIWTNDEQPAHYDAAYPQGDLFGGVA